MKQYIFILLLGLSLHTSAEPIIKTDTLSFISEGKKLTGLLDLPGNKKPAGLILLIPGSGKTTMVEGNGYYKRLRHFFVAQGFACYVWDKPGCGKSEGKFNDAILQSSAQEAIDAIEELKRRNIPGSHKVGLWGLSRGGWVCPMIIASYPSIAFWISVSGPDDKENAAYLLETNYRIEGKSEAQTQLLVSEWKNGYSNILRNRASFEAYQKATENLRLDSFWLSISGDQFTKEGYERTQKKLHERKVSYDEATGLQIYVPEFDKMLNRVSCPVLAVFGEKDSQIDWRKTIALYKKNIGRNPRATLTIKTFPDGNHNLFKCKTGGFREQLNKIKFCDGYFETMAAWLKEKGYSPLK